MHRFWDSVTRPLLEAASARTVVEIGSDRGLGTTLLLDWARERGATIHVIDPEPKYDVDAWRKEYRDSYVPYLAISLDAIPAIKDPDAVLIDGDHNWYTVINELRLLDRKGTNFPLVILHDVGWPYGDRDLYYDPSRIPAEYRHEHRRAAMRPGKPMLSDVSGINDHLENATRPGGPRNGVLTAVRDFVAESGRTLVLETWPGIHGLGILFEREALPQEVLSFIQSLRLSDEARALVADIETDRLALLEGLADRQRSHSQAVVALQGTRSELEELREESDRQVEELRQRLGLAMEELTDLRAQSSELQGQLSEQRLQSAALERLRRKLREAESRNRALRRRRSVRAALAIARAFSPFFRLARQRWLSPRRYPDLPVESLGPAAASERGAGSVTPAPERIESRETTGTGTESPATDRLGADIIVCVHNAPADVAACLESIGCHTNLLVHRVIVVDDGSDVETQAIIARHAVNLSAQVLRNEKAGGYTRAANRGLRESTAPYAVLLNSDAIVTPGWLERLIACARHRDDVGVVGPWSNAASWQSIPKMTDEFGVWHVNEVPLMGLDDFAVSLAGASPRIYPEVPLVNGFCYLITRKALDVIGMLDEETFPRGYGEEDDFSLRSRAAGLRHFIADDCYVYHAKSRSYGQSMRDSIVNESKLSLRDKHGTASISMALGALATDPEIVKARTYASLLATHTLADSPRPDSFAEVAGLRVAWLSPHLNVVGGVRRKLSMTNRLVEWGLSVTLVTPDGDNPTWLPIVADVKSVAEAANEVFDVVIVSDPDTWRLQDDIEADTRVVFHLAPYSIYRPPSEQLNQFYFEASDLPHLANSRWTQEQAIRQNPDLRFAGIVPGAVDRRLFHPRRVRRRCDVVCYGSKRVIKGTRDIAKASRGLKLLRMSAERVGQHDLAWLISSGEVFVSAARHEGFNLPPLEAMACGVPVVMTDDGGSRDYAINGENATVVPVGDVDALREGIDALRGNQKLASHRIDAGMRTAWEFTWERSATALVDGLSSILNEHGRQSPP